MADDKVVGLLGQLKSFKKTNLAKTETRVTTVDGKKMIETHDACGNYKSTVTNREEYGFVPDLVLDLQVGEILPGLIQASQDVAAELEILEHYKVTHILNIANYVKNYFPDRIKYLNLNIYDNAGFHILPFFKQAFDFIDEAREGGGCVLVHCNAGISRAATITTAYLMKKKGMPLKEAFAHVKSKRPSSSPNAGFQVQLETYEERLGLAKETSY